MALKYEMLSDQGTWRPGLFLDTEETKDPLNTVAFSASTIIAMHIKPHF